MAVANHVIEVGGKAFSVRLGWNAIRRIEETLQQPVQNIGMRMVLGHAGMREIGVVFWAGLETARLKEQSRPQPYTIDEVGDLIDEFGSDVFFELVYPQLLIALTDAFPDAKKAFLAKKAAKEGEANPPNASAGTGNSSSPTPSTPA